MTRRSEKVMKSLLSRCPPEQRKALERFLPENEQLFLNELPNFDETTLDSRYSEKGTLDDIHWSWIQPIIEGLSSKEQQLYLSALNEQAAESIATSLGLEKGTEKTSSISREFLRQKILDSLVSPDEHIIPPEYLPSSPLNRLVLLSKKDLIKLIDFLALYDLSIEFRQIVETKILKKIYSFLSDEQKALLQQITATSDANPFGRLNLDRWDESHEMLKNVLHRRGLVRLGAALSGQEPDLVWILCRKLDIGRGGALYKLHTKEAMPGVTEIARHQVEELMDKAKL
jgi:hypothetical protein